MKGHIRERSPGRWAIILDNIDPTNGKRRRRWHSFAGTKRQAQIRCAELIAELKNGTYLVPDKTTVARFLETWIEHIRPQVSPKTFERYVEICRNNLAPALGRLLIPKLTSQAISSAYAAALTGGRRNGSGGLSPRTVHHMHRVLKQALQQAVKWQLLVRNPADAVDPPRVERSSMQTYDVAQAAEMIDSLRPSPLFIPALLGMLCGLRRGEIAALRWRNVDLTSGQLSIAESAEQTKAGIRYKPPKSGKARTVALSVTMIEELRVHRLTQAEDLLRLGVRHTDDHFVAAHADGYPMTPMFISQHWAREIRKTGLPAYRFHDLRHAHATHLLGNGVHPKVASERLGHSKVGITLDLYSHVLPGMQQDAAARVDDAIQQAIRTRQKNVR